MLAVRGDEVLPLLISIDDPREVACVSHVRTLPAAGDEAGRRINAALVPPPETTAPPRYYRERAALAGGRGPTAYYRMAVTESGDNGSAPSDVAASVPPERPPSGADPGASATELLWIGTPMASDAGLLLVTGHRDATAYDDAEPDGWPLPLSRSLGVRVYESARGLPG